jgi:hypothetical protein
VLPDVAQQCVDAMHERVHLRRLRCPGHDQAGPGLNRQITDQRCHEFVQRRILQELRRGRSLRRTERSRSTEAVAELRVQVGCQRLHVLGAQRKAVVCDGSQFTERGFEHIGALILRTRAAVPLAQAQRERQAVGA